MGLKLLEPNMTSNNTPEPFVVTCSTVLSNNVNYLPYMCFKDYDGANDVQCWHSESESIPWIKIYVGKPISLGMISFRRRNDNMFPQTPSAFKVYVSNNDIDYTMIYGTNISLPDQFKYYDYPFVNNIYGKYIKITFTSGYCALNRIKLWCNEPYLINKDNELYSIDNSQYDTVSKKYQPLIKTTNIRDIYENNDIAFDELVYEKTIEDETFRPIDKLLPFRINKLGAK